MRTRQNLLSDKKLFPHVKITKPNRSPSVTGWASKQFTGPGLSRSSRYQARCAPAHTQAIAQLASIKRGSYLHARNATPSVHQTHAISQRVSRRLSLHTQLQGAQVAAKLILLARRHHGGHSRAEDDFAGLDDDDDEDFLS